MKIKNSQVVKKSKSKHKKQSKNRSKQRHFDPVAYLNTHLDLKDLKPILGKKKHNHAKRELSSALSSSNHPPDCTLSFSKIRSKSSHDHYKKNTIAQPLKSHLSVNLQAIITQQDNVQFTELTPRDHEPTTPQYSVRLSSKKMKQQRAAIVIQRAWKNYQTLKMIKYYQKKYSKPQKKKQNPVKNYKEHPDLQKTLKIKRNQPKNDIQAAQTQMFRAQLQNMDTIPIKDYEQGQSESDIIIRTPKNKQGYEKLEQEQLIDEFKQFKQISQQCSNYSQNSQKLKIAEFISKFQNNRQKVQQQFDKKIQNLFDSAKRFNKSFIDSESRQSQASENSQKSRISYQPEIKPTDLYSQKSQSQNSYNWYYQSVLPQYKIFEARLQVIKQKKQSDLKKVQKDILVGKISFTQGQRRTDRINGSYESQKRKIQSNKKNYAFSMQQLTRNALSCHKELNYLNKSQNQKNSMPLRNCFSSESVILKSILKETQIKDYCQKIIDFQPEQRLQLSRLSNQQSYYVQQQQIQSFERIIESSGSEISFRKQRQLQPSRNKEIDYEKIYQLTFDRVIDQAVRQIYIHEKLFLFVKPYIQQAFEFTRISDQQINEFMIQLRKFFPISNILMKRINQKINPSSLQILRIIRNCDYQVEQYELILGQEIFRNYRKAIQKKYEIKKIGRISKLSEVSDDIDNLQIVQKLFGRRAQKINKLEKYTCFQRDLFLMYMKAVFSSLNQLIIEAKSYNTYMNTRSSIGPGQLTLALKEYNRDCKPQQAQKIIANSEQKIRNIIKSKCSIPSFTNYQELEAFQRQISKQIRAQLDENQFKWVNFMDETLEIWQDICQRIQENLFQELIAQLRQFQCQL